MPPPTQAAVVLLSGGMDSAVVAALLRAEGFAVAALAVEYGQRHRAEVEAARALAGRLGCASFEAVHVDLARFGGSALTGCGVVPKDRPAEAIGADVPVTYVPARNLVLLALALSAAEARDADVVALGVNAVDYSGYPDCRPAFLEALRRVVAVGTRRGVEGRPIEVRAPLLTWTKAEIVRRGLALGVPFGETWSCYDPVAGDGRLLHCGRCDACRLRARAFTQAGAPDPTVYARPSPAP